MLFSKLQNPIAEINSFRFRGGKFFSGCHKFD